MGVWVSGKVSSKLWGSLDGYFNEQVAGTSGLDEFRYCTTLELGVLTEDLEAWGLIRRR
jgi:hypothetical protein